jgi:HEAT repeat-containing protein 5
LYELVQVACIDNLLLCGVTEASALNTPVEDPDAAAKDEDDDEGLNVKHTDADANRPTVAPRWPTRVFAIECMRKIMAACEGNDNHFNLAAAKALRLSGKGKSLNYFYKHK